MEREAVDRCQIQEWYPKLRAVSLRTEVHELPESFVRYLLDESGPFVLPLSISDDDAFPNRVGSPLDEPDLQINEETDTAEPSPTRPCFPDLERRVKASIESLGGAVFPKLNWSAPKDSAWISPTGTLCCSSFAEVVLLLRSSDSVVHDLCHAYDGCADRVPSRPPSFFLALRRWVPSLRPETEFRCFVRGREMVGISQREVTGFYPVLAAREERERVGSLVGGFFSERVKPVFGSEDYVFDVYVAGGRTVKLVDFNPWRGPTLPLLFEWDELEAACGGPAEMRVVETTVGVRPGLKTAVPYDYLDVGPGSGWDDFFRKVDVEQRLQQQTAEDED